MRLTASAPVTWPDRAAIDRWWGDSLRELTDTEVEYDGRIRDPRDPEPSGPRVRLVSGTHLASGASYVMEGEELGPLDVAATIGGLPTRRTAVVTITGGPQRLLSRGPLVEVHVDGLDTLASVRGTSTHRYVGGTLSITPDPQAPFELVLRLRWLAVDMRLRAVGGVLSASLQLGPRGVWSPATAPLIAILGRVLASDFTSTVEQWASDITAVAEGREPPSRAAQRARDQRLTAARWSRDRLRERLTQTEEQLAERGWWGTRRTAWLRAYAALPPLSWPTAPTTDGSGVTDFGALARAAAEDVALAPRRERRTRIEQVVEQFAWSDLLAERVQDAADAHNARAVPLTENDLELAWLRSPLTAWRHLKAEGAVTEDTPVGLVEEPEESSADPDSP